MNDLRILALPPVDLEVWILLGYAIAMLAGARITEALAQFHFRRARRLSEHGFEYDREIDHYRCPHGERLPLHVIDTQTRVAVYRAPATSCAGCPSKSSCTPHDEGRHIYRPLSEWAETDVGRFHHWLSLFIAGSAAALSLIGIIRFAGRPGTALLGLVFLVSATVAWRDVTRKRAPDRMASE